MADKIIRRTLYGVDVPIFSTDGLVLMLERSAPGERFRTGWEYVKGGIDGNESPIDAALREAHEEAGDLGYQVVAELPDKYIVDARYRKKPDYDYVNKRAVVLLAQTGGVRLDRNEHISFRWTTPEEAKKIIWVEQGIEILAKAEEAFREFIKTHP